MRARKSLLGNKSATVTAACLTFFDTHDDLNCTVVSKDLTTVCAGFGDSCVRVWRLDDQDVGTPYGGMPSEGKVPPPSGAAEPRAAAAGAAVAPARGAGAAAAGAGAGAAAGAPAHPSGLFGALSDDPVDDADIEDRPGLAPDSAADGSAGAKPLRRSVAVLAGHATTVTAVAISPDMKWLLSGALDGSIRLWDLASQQTVVRLVCGASRWSTCAALCCARCLFVTLPFPAAWFVHGCRRCTTATTSPCGT